MAKLVILTGKHEGKRLDLPEKKLLVGREKTCDLALRTTEVSRRHCLIRVEEGRVTVKDLGSRNGTHVNDVPAIGEVELFNGDTLRVGPMLFRVEIPEPEKSVSHYVEGDSQVEIREATDDSIVDWLAIDEPDGGTGNSTIISKSAALGDDSADSQADTDTIDVTPLVTVPPPSKKSFESVAEEAADIIRRHREMKQQQLALQQSETPAG